MNVDILEQTVTFLSSLGLGTPAVSLFAQTLPTTPANCTALILTGGPDLPGDPVRRPSMQVLHRNKESYNGLTAISSLHAAMADEWNKLPWPYAAGRFVSQTEPGAYFRDSNSYFVYTLNFVFVTTKQQ